MRPSPIIIEKRSAITGVVVGALYGIAVRLVFGARLPLLEQVFGVMTLGFVFIVPIVLGAITVHALALERKQKIAPAILLPWTSVSLSLAAMLVLKIEGLICVIMALPILLILSSIGGLLMRWYDLARARRNGTDRNQANLLLLLLPFLLTPAEKQIRPHDQLRMVTTSIVIDRSPEAVWPQISDVPIIRDAERPRRLSAFIGIPDPLEARLLQKRVGGIRFARFAGGIKFEETVTRFRPPYALAFTIHANTSQIPSSTLDEHVLVGGPYFDVLSGGFELQPIDRGHTRLVLRSVHRLSTHFNAYAGFWTDWVMRDVQTSLLQIIKARCERTGNMLSLSRTVVGYGTVARLSAFAHAPGRQSPSGFAPSNPAVRSSSLTPLRSFTLRRGRIHAFGARSSARSM